MKKWIIVVVCSLFVNSVLAQMVVPKPKGYVDLGLPSGTLWKETNEDGWYRFKDANSKFKDQLPTKEEWQELKDNCLWYWFDSGTGVEGYLIRSNVNGNKLFLPIPYMASCGEVSAKIRKDQGMYWSRTTSYNSQFNEMEAFVLDWVHTPFTEIIEISTSTFCIGTSVRLVTK